MSERERSQRERGARRAGRLAPAPGALSEEWTQCERERSQRERGATPAGRPAAPRVGAGMGGVPASLSKEWE